MRGLKGVVAIGSLLIIFLFCIGCILIFASFLDIRKGLEYWFKRWRLIILLSVVLIGLSYKFTKVFESIEYDTKYCNSYEIKNISTSEETTRSIYVNLTNDTYSFLMKWEDKWELHKIHNYECIGVYNTNKGYDYVDVYKNEIVESNLMKEILMFGEHSEYKYKIYINNLE